MQIFEMPATPTDDSSSRNEALDIRVAATAALYIRGPVNWDMEEKRNLDTIPVAGKTKEKAKPRQRRNFLSEQARGSFWNR
jgi:phage terminase large subunit GpA-like protein